MSKKETMKKLLFMLFAFRFSSSLSAAIILPRLSVIFLGCSQERTMGREYRMVLYHLERQVYDSRQDTAKSSALYEQAC